jgi:hypothetical protein
MRRFRILLSLLLGLSLMTQGMTVAVAAVSAPMKIEMASSSMMSMDMSADMQDMPCMDMDMSDHGGAGHCPAKCCDGKICPEMSHCTQAQAAIAAYFVPVVYSDVQRNVPMALLVHAVLGPPSSLFRPPISSLN